MNYETLTEASERLNISASHLRNLSAWGKIPGAVKRAGAWFIPASFHITKSHNGRPRKDEIRIKKEA